MLARLRSRDQRPDPRFQALQALQAKVMVADADLTIVHVNESLRQFLLQAEGELRQVMPGFRADALIGQSIDAFHRDPGHQRRMLAALQTPHLATITVGSRMFDLAVTPLREGETPLGFVVEWGDSRARLTSLDNAAQAEAVDRSHATIHFTPDGVIVDANDNFLRTVGYARDDIIGKHHRIFLFEEDAASAEYATFWQKLARGEIRAARFRRRARDGREIWIEGAYNPVRGPNGQVTKIVKVVSDITAQMQLLAELKGVIGEIDGTVDLSNRSAAAAQTAAEETKASVLAVAENAEQLAAAASNIAESMARSQAATVSATEQVSAMASGTETLAEAAQAMTGIVGLIRDITSQINLLALNATIEAARAGDAGKGFAVVAGEVKSLAIQAARATEQITAEIERLQGTSQAVTTAVGTIRDAVEVVRDSVASTASAIDQQRSVTATMSNMMRGAADRVGSVAGTITAIAEAAAQAGAAVSRTRTAAEALDR